MKGSYLFLAALLSFKSIASGIPVVDVASLSQMITDGLTRAKEFKENMDEARNRLNQLKAQQRHYEKMVEGHYEFEDVLNDPYVNEFMALDDWKQIYNDSEGLSELRDEFDMHSDNPAVQRRYDNELKRYNAQSKYYKTVVDRNRRMAGLLEQFSGASTPAAKSDIANAISFEQTQVQNDTQMMNTMNELMDKQERLRKDTETRERTRVMLNEGITVPKLEL